MISDKQFNDSFTAAGGWFFLTQFETIKFWTDSKLELIDYIYTQGFDKKREGSSARVSGSLRIINQGREIEALIKIRDSKKINQAHPEAKKIARDLLLKHFNL